MARFTTAEFTEFRKIRAACYQGLDSVELLTLVGQRLQGFLSADAFCANAVDPTTVFLTRAASDGWPDEARPLFVERVYLQTRAADPGRILLDGRRSVDMDDLLSYQDTPQKDPYFQFHLLPFGYRYEMQLLCSLRGAAHEMLTLTRSSVRGRFPHRHLRLLDALAPHIAGGLARARLRKSLRPAEDSRLGFLLLDERGHIDLASDVAEEWLQADASPGGSLGLPLLMRLASRAASEAEATDGVPVIELCHPRTGALHRIHWEQQIDSAGRPRTMILFEPVRRLDKPETHQRLGLTRREVDVTLAMVRGLPNKELAVRLRLSPHTASQHIKNIFTKLGVSSRGELAARSWVRRTTIHILTSNSLGPPMIKGWIRDS